MTQLTFYNTLDRKKSPFSSIEKDSVKLYTCGQTVYNYAHIGNFRTYIFEDLLKRVLKHNKYDVTHVMNVTDVGHLESDADDGEDKLNKAAKKENKDVWEIARYYEKSFFEDYQQLNLIKPNIICRATDHIENMIDMISKLEEKGYTYTVDGNVYFNIERFPDYTKLAQLDFEGMKSGSRIDIDSRKKHPADFVLWFSQSKFPNQIMKWDSPWGKGFPGWHIECSAMATKYLGEFIDIHCGGIDHVPVHHTNEIAQAECALGHQWVRWWLHGEFLILDNEKMSKSSENFLTLKNFCAKGFKPLHFRYFCMGAHYRSQLAFTWESAESARNTYESLLQRILSWKRSTDKIDQGAVESYRQRFDEDINDDLNFPKALATVWEVAKSTQLRDATKRSILLDFDNILGLDFDKVQRPPLTPEQTQRLNKREEARKNKDWKASDELRDKFLQEGIVIKDTPEGPDWHLSYSD